MNAISPIRSSICLRSRGATKKGLITSTGECGTDSSAAVRKRSVGAHRPGTAARSESSSDSPLEGAGFELPVPRENGYSVVSLVLCYPLKLLAFCRRCRCRVPRGTEKFADSPLERAGFELSVPGDGELCWGALTLGCIRGDRSAGAGTVQCDFFCSAGFENAQATRFFPAQYERVSRAIRAARRNGAEQRESRLAL